LSEGGVQVVNVIADLFMPVGIDPDGIIDLVWDDNGAIVTATINAAGDLITFMSTGPTSFDSKRLVSKFVNNIRTDNGSNDDKRWYECISKSDVI